MSVVEIVGESSEDVSLFLTCEHAGNEIPPEMAGSEKERRWLEDHWGWDIGAERLVRSMVDQEDAYAVMSRYSRLLCDVNRSLQQDELVRSHVMGEPIGFNRQLGEEGISERVERYHEPYHEAVDRHLGEVAEENPELFLISVHTFTPVLGDEVRDMEIGLLFDEGQEPYVYDIHESIRQEEFRVALNEPYSGKNDLIYSVERHGSNHGVRFVELEVRNDLVDTAEGAHQMADLLVGALRRVPWYG